MNDTVSALILSQSDYRDADVIIRVLTKEYGLLSFIAKGARKMTSKNAGSIIPVTKAEIQFDYKDGQTMFRLKTAGCASGSLLLASPSGHAHDHFPTKPLLNP